MRQPISISLYFRYQDVKYIHFSPKKKSQVRRFKPQYITIQKQLRKINLLSCVKYKRKRYLVTLPLFSSLSTNILTNFSDLDITSECRYIYTILYLKKPDTLIYTFFRYFRGQLPSFSKMETSQIENQTASRPNKELLNTLVKSYV